MWKELEQIFGYFISFFYSAFTAEYIILFIIKIMESQNINPLMQFMNYGIQPATLETYRNRDVQQEFQQIMSAMMFSQIFNPLGDSTGGESLSGSDNIMSPLMMMLMGSLNTNLSSGMSTLGSLSNELTLQQAQTIHINQFDAENQVGGDGANANCGPTALAMALHGVGLAVAGESSGSLPGEVVDMARRSMIADSYRDGVFANGQRAEAEHNSYTNFSDVMRGVQAAGASGQLLAGNSEAIRSALLGGAKVVVSGTFAGKSPLPWTGDRGVDNQIAPGGATAHFVTVSSYDQQRDLFTINDPARRTPLVVTGSTLEYFMRGNGGALAVQRS
ncbi:MAG: hypothetical protein CVU39_09840 [Chloroflexi bacterium HGW-Chloroflexi-10]|nr:MAG: hypothetical protein CVU39_09840 [Chloroflexi bacterium HGW-Chloroflexi-10]